ncbi:unnamed protein product [Phytophthora fragariaefolia]|uniref:Unnamed protein product n=1 Tax=Phytophthora fragariaefolia TaxID=1490495 RepID=A0A9W6Y1P2_9STRA|nr:unnamed protein product [Phytophthora fragariaefolia]
MDLIPPVEAPVSQAASQGLTSAAVSIGMPLQPPPGLMMRALSPPTSLLPDFGDVAPLSLLGDATGASSGAVAVAAPAPTTVTTAVKRELQVVKPAVAGAAAAMRRKAELATAASVAHKKQKTDNMKPEPVKPAPPAPLSVHQQIQQQQARHHLHNASNPLSASAAAAAAAAAAAREKVMKEPQSGDLYECVITKRNGGLGLTLACVDDHVQITGLAPDTPAANSGICVGDTLVAVSGLPVRGLQFSTVIGRLKSTSRNSVVLKLRRNPCTLTSNALFGETTLTRFVWNFLHFGSDSSNSANVLSSKTMALETRLGGGLGNGLNGSAGTLGGATSSLHNGSASAGIDELHRSHHQGAAGLANHASGLHAQHLQMQLKSEPMNSTYFPTDASVLTMGATVPGSSTTAVPPSVLAPSSTIPSEAQTALRVTVQEKDRYHAECRALRHELGRAMVAQRIQKRDTEAYTSKLQAVIDKFRKDVQSLLPSAPKSATDSSTTEKNDATTTTAASTNELASLRQKLMEANQALAKQKTEMLALLEREARHALPEAQRVKWQLVSHMRKSVLQIDCKAASKLAATPVVKKVGASSCSTLTFEERVDGVRPSSFALLVGQSSVKPESPTVEVELDAKASTEVRSRSACGVRKL